METKYLCLDIETAPIYSWVDLPDRLRNIWLKKTENRFQECINIVEKYDKNVSFFSLFSKIICISVSFADKSEIKSYIGDEIDILNQLSNDLLKISKIYNLKFVGHNITTFDMPFILQRSLINKISMPIINKIIGCKPWEVPFFDTMLMWRATSNEWCPLDYICEALGLSNPKDELQGSQKDVIAVKQVFNILFNAFNS